MIMNNLKINIGAAIMGIINCIVFAVSWPVIFGAAVSDGFTGTNITSGTGAFFYAMAAIGLVLNIVALIQSKQVGISIVGPVLGIVGNGLFILTALMAFPAIIVLIISVVFLFMHRPSSEGYKGQNGKQNPYIQTDRSQYNQSQYNQQSPQNQQYQANQPYGNYNQTNNQSNPQQNSYAPNQQSGHYQNNESQSQNTGTRMSRRNR